MTKGDAPILTLEKLTFGQGDFSLSADLTLSHGQVTAIIGPSGAGKSTLLHGIAGFVPQIAGRLLWQGVEITQLTPEQRPVSMLFQDNNLFPHLTVLQNVALALTPKLRPSSDVVERVEDVLSQVSLSGLSKRKPAELSGGQQSRVALARALLQDRPIMLMDEPFSALGPALKREMLRLSISLAAQRTLVMVTHDPTDAVEIAHEVIGVANGSVSRPMETPKFMANPPEPFGDYFGNSITSQ